MNGIRRHLAHMPREFSHSASAFWPDEHLRVNARSICDRSRTILCNHKTLHDIGPIMRIT